MRVAFPTGEAALNLMTDAKPALPATEPPGWYEPALELQGVFAEDAMGSFSRVHHEFAVKNIFPRLGRVRSANEILQSLE